MTTHPAPDQHPLDLETWWMYTAVGEISAIMPKVKEYGATDLLWVGRQMAEATGRPAADDEEATELGIYWFILGKIARWHAAVTEGRRPSDDTIFDLGVYTRMAQRVRESGTWPGEVV